MNYCKKLLLPHTDTSRDRPIGGDRFSFPLQNWHRAATYIPKMLSKCINIFNETESSVQIIFNI